MGNQQSIPKPPQDKVKEFFAKYFGEMNERLKKNAETILNLREYTVYSDKYDEESTETLREFMLGNGEFPTKRPPPPNPETLHDFVKEFGKKLADFFMFYFNNLTPKDDYVLVTEFDNLIQFVIRECGDSFVYSEFVNFFSSEEKKIYMYKCSREKRGFYNYTKIIQNVRNYIEKVFYDYPLY